MFFAQNQNKMIVRNLMSPKDPEHPKCLNFLPFLCIVFEGKGTYLYIGWLSVIVCFTINCPWS